MHDKITQTHYTMMTDASGAGVLVPAGSGVSGCEGSIRLTQAIAYMPSAELPVFSSTLVADAQGKPRTLEEAVDEALEVGGRGGANGGEPLHAITPPTPLARAAQSLEGCNV